MKEKKKSTGESEAEVRLPSHEDIAKRAYEIYLARGGEPGHELDDWFQAENELREEGRPMPAPAENLPAPRPSRASSGRAAEQGGPRARGAHKEGGHGVSRCFCSSESTTQEAGMLRSMKGLEGFTIGAADGDIGRVDAFAFDDQSFTVRHLVVDTSSWLTGRKVLVSPIALRGIDWHAERMSAELTKLQVEQSPDIDTDRPVSRQRELEYHRYYGYPYYWAGPYLWGPIPYPGMGMTPGSGAALERERRWNWEQEPGDPHLRSSAEVIGYYIQATDGDIGHVEDFLVDDSSWAIRYMIVDTRNWWPGKKVLVSPEWIEHVDWSDSKVYVDLTREQIRNSPEYDASAPVDRAYETRLYGHYGRPRYW